MKRRVAGLLVFGIALGIAIPLAIGGREVFALLGAVSPLTFALLLAMMFVVWNVSAGRLRLLSGGAGVRLGQARAFSIVLATEFTTCLTPAGSGGYATYAWLLGRHGLSPTRGVALCVADRFIDAAFFFTAVCVFALYWLATPLAPHVGWQLAAMAVLLVALMGSIWLFVDNERRIFRASAVLLGWCGVPMRWRRRLARHALGFHHSLRLVQGFPRRRLGAVFLLCACQWLLRYSVLYLAVAAVGGTISWSYAFVVQMLSLSAGQFSLMPGGSGVAEASSTLLLTTRLDAATAAAAILLWRFVTYHWYVIAGAPVFAALAGRPVWRRVTGG
jgi:uncharacterized protein (TIRG00374 family)